MAVAKALVITSTSPPVAGRDVEGHYKRLRLLMGAVGAVADRVEVLHLVPRRVMDAHPDPTELNRSQTAYWGFPVSATLVAWREREETILNHHVKGIFTASRQEKFFGPSGERQAAAVAQALDRGPDLVFVHRLPAMCAFLRTGRRARAVAFDIDDVEHRMKLRAALHPPLRPGKLFSLAQVPAVFAAERAAVARSRLTFVCSETDRQGLRRLGLSRGVTVVPNAVEVPDAPPPLPAEPTLLFMGDYGYDPNREAAERGAARILPAVRRRVPDAKLLIAGKRTERLDRAALAGPGVECLGFVEDLGRLYARARAICCPISNGGGTRVKLIEGAAYGRPLVSTHVGAEGLGFADGREILLADGDDDLAAGCARVLADDALCHALGAAARDKARAEYDAGRIQDRVAGLLRGVMAGA